MYAIRSYYEYFIWVKLYKITRNKCVFYSISFSIYRIFTRFPVNMPIKTLFYIMLAHGLPGECVEPVHHSAAVHLAAIAIDAGQQLLAVGQAVIV